ncbi:MAG TPA: ABC transporter permease [Thermoanaerobaculia bacterium]|jgi:putative ABC transport system permease protein|nr:ABC transporter permease [Thermoanaerobaculia bacterium]
METFLIDLRYTLRGLARTPGFTAAAVASLALGIGANTLIFTFLNALFLAPLPVSEPQRLMSLYEKDAHKPALLPFSLPNYDDLRRGNPVFSDAGAAHDLQLSLAGSNGEPEMLPGMMVTGNYFAVLGITPYRGRFFLPEESGTGGTRPVVVIGYGLWQRRFGGDPGVLGSTLQINGQGCTVIGILPANFKGVSLLAEPPQLWVPVGLARQMLSGPDAAMAERRGMLRFAVVARLKPGTGVEMARGAMATVAHQLERVDPIANQDLEIAALPLAETTVDPARRSIYLLAGGMLAVVVGLLLLIAAANVANLLLVRALGRSREITVRLALGSGRRRLARQLLTEGATLSLLGGAAGLLLASWGRELLWRLRPPFFPDTLALGIDWRVLAFTFLVALVTGLLFGLAPVVQSFRFDLSANLGHQASGIQRGTLAAALRTLMLVGQIALSVVILAGAGLFLHSLQVAAAVDPGFERERLFVIPLNLSVPGYTPQRAQQFYERAVERVAALPGVRAAAVASRFLLVDSGSQVEVEAAGQQARADRRGVQATVCRIGPHYFETVGIPLRSGRPVVAEDRADGRQVAVVNETLAHWLWPGESALGKRFRFSGGDGPWLEVVGVAANARYQSLGAAPEGYVYQPVAQRFAPVMLLHVRTVGDPLATVPSVRQEVKTLDPTLPLPEPRTIAQLRNRSLWAPRMGAGLLSLFGLLALALSAIGAYGVLAFAVGQRRREIAIRMATGAGRRDVLRLVLADGIKPVLAGVVVGLLATPLAARPIAQLLVGIGAADPLAIGGATALLLAVALFALYVPARRAAGLDPMQALRVG